ncbi:hypothetical protein [Sphingobacterium deserti]|uniref:Uncharacterized protein n=1 Tax=Sphingobacterium deserti TaxID=1229276 RepID=A0A0B8T4F8_9SPHI|nr:hypothetical protein [Sphingobacterium deserti]KGE14603.1 hypothetical protein DI53_1632 [Sphingobacterium deserti]
MEFVALSHILLRTLKWQGYTVLRSVSPLNSTNPTWYAEKIPIEQLMDLDSDEIARRSVPLQETHYLIIQDALENIREEDLIGQVFLGVI